MSDKAIITCALTGVLTNPEQHPVPVTPEQMAATKEMLHDLNQMLQDRAQGREPNFEEFMQK